MEMRHLRCFVAVAEHLHFGRAAEQLHMSAAVEPADQEPGRELGILLFYRKNKGSLLLMPGGLSAEDAREILRRTESAATARDIANGC
jgi:DNA-binding transcriptional LysR family regulator